MATPRLAKRLSELQQSPKARRLRRREKESRRLHLETLEDRRLMAVGPSLVAIVSNNGDFLDPGDTLNIAPRDLTFRFSQGAAIDPGSIPTGIQLVRAGGDKIFGNANDVVVTPGFLGNNDLPREVVMRFAATLPDDTYRVTIVGAGTTPLKDTAGNPFNAGLNQQIDFNLDLGTKITAVVPQPITRVGNLLSQNARTIEVYFDQNQLALSAVQSPGFYRLIDSTEGSPTKGSITLPASVAVVTDAVTLKQKATLTFAADIPAGTFKLEIGTTYESDGTLTQARHVANTMSSPTQAFIGDRIDGGGSQSNDVDLYRFDLRVGATLNATVTPAAGLDAVIRIFDAAGVEVAIMNNGATGAAENLTTAAPLVAGTYYVGVSSANNIAYNAVSGAAASNGTSTGAYSIQVQFNDAPPINDVNSSFADAALNAALGTIGLAGRTVSGANIGPQPYNIQFPGAGDAPGERNIPYQAHIQTIPGLDPDPFTGIREITYDFQLIYGFTPQGQPLSNAITEEQKQRVREVLELYGRYLGVQFREVPSSNVGTDMTIATGDPRAVAPTISTGTAPNGVNGIAGSANIPVGSLTAGVRTNTTGTITGATSNFAADNTPIIITSANHGLVSGTRVEVSGVQGNTFANGVWTINVIDANTFSLIGSQPNAFYNGGGTWRVLDVSKGVAIMNALVNWGNSEYGGAYFRTAMNEVGHLLGLGPNFEAAALTIMGGEQTPSQAANRATAEGVFPGDADIVYGQALHRPESRDIDLYQFVVTEAGLFRAETIAERLANSSLLNTVLTLYQESAIPGQPVTRQVIARNDDYYGNDSYLELQLDKGTYYVGVTSVGNIEFDPAIRDSGFGGRTQGGYNLKLEMKPDAGSTMADTSGIRFDGDADNRPGGTYEFWFQSNTPATTIYVDKTSAAALPDGSLARPFNNLPAAIAAASQPGTRKIVRIVGNGGVDGDINTVIDNAPYLVGFKDLDAVLDQPLTDGGDFLVPQDVTVMIDAGAIIKMRKANLNTGTTPQGLVSGARGAIQVLGTPTRPVQFTSYADDSIGGDSDGPSAGAAAGDYGGIVFREDSDRELSGVFLNYVNNAVMSYGGGRVLVDSVVDTYTPIHLASARPALSYNTIQLSANAAVSADPNSFDDDGQRPGVAFDARRIGPDIHDNTVGFLDTSVVNRNNNTNGMFIRVKTVAGNPLDLVDLTTRWDDADIVHVISENVLIAGTPGGSSTADADRPVTTLTDGRLRIDPGVIVKLNGARIEATISSQFIAEGTLENPIIFTSLKDDKYGAGGSFDTNRDAAATGPAPGQWGGLVFGAASSGSLDRVSVFYAGGSVPIEGNFDRFNAVEIQQADVRIANSLFQFNDGGGSTTDRNGRGFNSNAVIFVRGAQPVIVGNTIRDNSNAQNNNGPAISINANALQETRLADYGRATGRASALGQFNDNHGPLIRLNRMINNSLNGMEVRGGTLTTETVWDDTDIAHILRSEIIVSNHQVYSGLRLQSNTTESLVVKLLGSTAGFTASGRPLDIVDRIGGTIHVIGQPGYPVVLTSLADDSVPAGFNPSGLPIFDTNNNGSSTAPTGGDWRSVNLDQYSNDRNVAQVLERESAYTGNVDTNPTTPTAQPLGQLARNEKSGDDNRRLGFEVDGTISYNRPSDVDVYSFKANPGTEVWFDLDRTSYGLDVMLELIDASGAVLARATDTNPEAPIVNSADPGLTSFTVQAQSFNKDHFNGRDTYTTNPRDAIMRVVLPGTQLPANEPSTYYIRVRSQPANFTGESGNTLNPGLTSGHYQLQVRVNQKDEKPGSTVKFADIRYATNGIEVHGLPYHSPLTGETAEADSAANGTQATAQFIGNLLRADRNTISVGGDIANLSDIDFYQFDLTFDLLEFVNNYTNGFESWATIFDLDYGDGLSRADATISVFNEQGQLILIGRDSDVQDDQGTSGSELSSGSFGKQDPYIGPVQLPAGAVNQRRTYYVAVTNNRQLPTVLNQTFNPTPTNTNVRLEPIDSVARTIEDHLEAYFLARPTGGSTAEFPENVYIDPNNSTNGATSSLIDPTTVQALSANIKPFTLADVPLFVTDGGTLYNVDAASGTVEVFYNVAPGIVSGANNGGFSEDLAFRTDGLLYSYEGGLGGVQNSAGRLSLVDPEDGLSTSVGNDGIPDLPATPPTPLDPQQITTNLGLGAAMAIGGTVIGNLQNNTSLVYAIPEPNVVVFDPTPANPNSGDEVRSTVSRLYVANPTNGSAAVVQGQPWGRVGGINSFINAAVPASASTTFGLPGAPVSVTFSSAQVGPSGNGTIVNFLPPTDFGVPGPPLVVVTPGTPGPPATPARIDITLNTNASPTQAQATADFGTGYIASGGLAGGAIQVTATATGAAGNGVRVIFQQSADLNSAGEPTIAVDDVARTVTVTLDNGLTSTTPTTIAQLAGALSNLASSLVSASAVGDTTILIGDDVGNPPFLPIVLGGGADGGGNTAQQLVDAINATPGNVLRASLSGPGINPGATVISGQTPGTDYPNPLTLDGGRFSVGVTTGMAYGSDNFTLYGVTRDGVFMSGIGDNFGPGANPAAPARAVTVLIPDVTNPSILRPAPFEGLTRGPQNLENGRFANMFFGVTGDDPTTPTFESSRLVAMDINGVPQTVFDTNGDGTSDSVVLNLGMFGASGVAFSPFDYNLWHPTFRQQDAPGHDVGQSPTLGSQLFTLDAPASGRGSDSINMSFYFGNELRNTNPGFETDTYQIYPVSGPGIFGTGNTQLLGHNGQYGQLSDLRQRELTNAASNGGLFENNYNLPGGAQGSLITDEFSLSNLKATDKPTFYFDYFLETQDANFNIQAGGRMRDSARVYIGPFLRTDQFTGQTYETWDLLATNNDVQDSPGTGSASSGNPLYDGELPTFQSTSVTANPDNPRQQVQLMHDNTGSWRQARVDLARYAGMTNLKLRFDFSTAGTMTDPDGQLPPLSQSQAAIAGNEFLFENQFGNLQTVARGQQNQFEGFFVDNIIVGAAERGEMVINAPVDPTFFATPVPVNLDTTVPVPTEVTTGPYQLEIRRGAEYALSDGGNVSTITPLLAFDTNDRLMPDKRLQPAFAVEDFQSSAGTAELDPTLPWSATDDTSWSLVAADVAVPGSTGFVAASGLVTHGQRSGFEISLITGAGLLEFDQFVSSEQFPFAFNQFDGLRLYIDGRLADLNPDPQIYQPAQWSGTTNTGFSHVTVPVAAGRHNFRWVYEKDASGSAGLDRAFIDNIVFPTAQIGQQDIYDDPDLHDETDLNGVNPPPLPTLPPPTSTSQIRRLDTLYRGFTRGGDQNVHREQGHIQIEQNQVFASLQAGILVDAGVRDLNTDASPIGSVRNLPTLNNERLVPGLTLINNAVSNSGQVGIRFSGDANAPDAQGNAVPVAAVPFARIINNTIYGGATPTGTGIQIDVNAGPTILNNIVANTVDGITVDPSSNATTLLGANLYAGNVNNGALGTSFITLASSSGLFVNPAARNFYPQAGSPAIDSSASSLADRPGFVVVKSAVGIPDSPIRAPDLDLYFQSRVDEPSKDRGAVERADFSRPFAELIDPQDNDILGRDRNPNPNDVVVRNELLRRFVVKLHDLGVSIEDARITSSLFTITQDGVLLSDQVDYEFVYDPGKNEAIFTPSSGVWPLNHTYTIKIDNSPTGVADLAGNTLQANRTSGEVLFNIFTGIVRDFGDAPAPYPTLTANNGAAHDVVDGFHLGATVSEEQNGFPSASADGDTGDDGVTFVILPSPGLLTTVRVNASAPGVLDAWFDLNRDGVWDASEKLISGQALVAGNNTISFTYGTAQALKGTTFARFRFTTAGINSPTGVALDGEVEDYRVVVGGPPFQNPVNALDVSNDGFIAPFDAILVINFLNFYGRLVGGNMPLPPTSPPFPAPAPVIDPTGGGIPNQGRYLDVDGDGFLSPTDAVLVINYLNSPAFRTASGGGSGEGESAAAVPETALAAAAPASADMSASLAGITAPAVLYASPDVVLEVRERPATRPAAPVGPLVAQDQALLAINPELGPIEVVSPDPMLDLPAARSSSSAEPSWDDLLTDLAHDQKHLRSGD